MNRHRFRPACTLSVYLIAVVWILSTGPAASARGPTVVVGCKVFPESAILQQVAVQTLKPAGVDAVAEKPLGGTTPNWAALQSGDIDIYPEYTGTIAEQIFKTPAGWRSPESGTSWPSRASA